MTLEISDLGSCYSLEAIAHRSLSTNAIRVHPHMTTNHIGQALRLLEFSNTIGTNSSHKFWKKKKIKLV